MQSTFRKGESTFKCDWCGKLTRYTGIQSLGTKLCPYCYEEAGVENELSDGLINEEEYSERIAELKKRYRHE